MMNKHKISTVVLFILILIGVAGAVVVNIDGSALVAKTNLTTCIGNNATQWNGTVGNCILTSSGGVTNATVNPYSSNASNVTTGTIPISVMPSIMAYTNGTKISAYNDSKQLNVADSADVKVNFNSEHFDSLNEFANSRFTATQAGNYSVQVILALQQVTLDKPYQAQIFKNGALYSRSITVPASSSYDITAVHEDVVPLAVGDYIEIYEANFAGTGAVDIYGTPGGGGASQVVIWRQI